MLREERRVLALCAREFDAARYFEAHEHFEIGWRASRARGAAEHEVWRALVLLAGAWHHHAAGRAKGHAALKAKAVECLGRALADAALPPAWRERALRVEALIGAVRPPALEAALVPPS